MIGIVDYANYDDMRRAVSVLICTHCFCLFYLFSMSCY